MWRAFCFYFVRGRVEAPVRLLRSRNPGQIDHLTSQLSIRFADVLIFSVAHFYIYLLSESFYLHYQHQKKNYMALQNIQWLREVKRNIT